MSSNLSLKIRLRKLGSNRFVTHTLDEETYSIDDLQQLINYGREHRSQVSISIKSNTKKIIKFTPTEYDNIAVVFEYE